MEQFIEQIRRPGYVLSTGPMSYTIRNPDDQETFNFRRYLISYKDKEDEL